MTAPLPTARAALASWPTPLEAAPRLAEAIGHAPDRLWVKRDDLVGLGAGGNKVRKLEWTVGAALAEGADTLVTTGAPQSNHARLTAAAAARTGLDCVLVLPGGPDGPPRGNLVLDGLLGARIAWAGELGHGDLDAAARDVADGLRSRGRRPVVVPFGGTSATGAHGYRLAARELTAQLADLDADLDLVVTALGSGGTMAGLVAGLGPRRVLGVHTGAVADPGERVAALLAEMGTDLTPGELRIDHDQVGAGYDTLTAGTAEAMRTAARTHGLVLDPVYSGRAMAGLVAAVASGRVGPREHVVLLATGGLPGLFGHPDAATLAT